MSPAPCLRCLCTPSSPAPACPVRGALLVETGLDFDRAWMVVDEHGEMLTQRELPRLALVQPSFKPAS
jgi:uncharacterized protein YcbX